MDKAGYLNLLQETCEKCRADGYNKRGIEKEGYYYCRILSPHLIGGKLSITDQDLTNSCDFIDTQELIEINVGNNRYRCMTDIIEE